ncbi:MAG: hypothetical protein ACI9TH_000368 [Kiritimatiellia bacterium]
MPPPESAINEPYAKPGALDLWSFHKVMRWLVPLILFTISVSVLVGLHRSAGVHPQLGDEAGYLDLSVANNLSGQGKYLASKEDVMPFTGNVLWHYLLAITTKLIKDPVNAAYLLGYFFSLSTLLVCVQIARRLLGFQPYVIAALCFLALSPAMVYAATSGGPLALAMLLIALALERHLGGLHGQRTVLPASAALFIGLAMLIRIEFVLLWVIFWLHAGIASTMHWNKRLKAGVVATQGLTGLLICLVLVWPLINKNVLLIKVAWPAPVQMSSELLPRIVDSFSLLFASSILGPIEGVLLLFGLVMAGYSLSAHRRQVASLLPILLATILPFSYALMSIFTGWQGAELVLYAFAPVYILTGVYGLFRFPGIIKAVNNGGGKGAIAGFAVLLLLIALIRIAVYADADLKQRKAFKTWQDQYVALIEKQKLIGGICLTDQPGWIGYTGMQRPIDLTGRSSVAVLKCAYPPGGLDEAKIIELTRARQPELLVLWQEAHYPLAERMEQAFGRRAVRELVPEHPKVLQIDWKRVP